METDKPARWCHDMSVGQSSSKTLHDMTRSFACSWIKLKAISGFSLIGEFLCASVGQEGPGLTWVHRNIRLTSVLVNLMQSVAWWLIEILLKNRSANTDTKNKNTDTNTYTLKFGLWWGGGNRVEKCKPIINLRFNCKWKNTVENTVTNNYRCKKILINDDEVEKCKRIINLRLKPKFFFPPLSSTQYWSILSHVPGQRRDLSRIFTNQLNSGNWNEIVFMCTWSIETSSQG